MPQTDAHTHTHTRTDEQRPYRRPPAPATSQRPPSTRACGGSAGSRRPARDAHPRDTATAKSHLSPQATFKSHPSHVQVTAKSCASHSKGTAKSQQRPKVTGPVTDKSNPQVMAKSRAASQAWAKPQQSRNPQLQVRPRCWTARYSTVPTSRPSQTKNAKPGPAAPQLQPATAWPHPSASHSPVAPSHGLVW